MSTQQDLTDILTEAERQRRGDRARQASTGTTVAEPDNGLPGPEDAGQVVVLGPDGYIPRAYLPPGTGSGGGGTGAVYRHVQDSASTTWTVAHMLGARVLPVVTVNGDDRHNHAELHYPDDNHTVLVFSRPMAGQAVFTT